MVTTPVRSKETSRTTTIQEDDDEEDAGRARTSDTRPRAGGRCRGEQVDAEENEENEAASDKEQVSAEEDEAYRAALTGIATMANANQQHFRQPDKTVIQPKRYLDENRLPRPKCYGSAQSGLFGSISKVATLLYVHPILVF